MMLNADEEIIVLGEYAELRDTKEYIENQPEYIELLKKTIIKGLIKEISENMSWFLKERDILDPAIPPTTFGGKIKIVKGKGETWK